MRNMFYLFPRNDEYIKDHQKNHQDYDLGKSKILLKKKSMKKTSTK